MSVCRTLTASVQPVWPIVLYGRMLLHISVQCRTGTQLLPKLSTRNPQFYFIIFQLAIQPPYLYVVGITVFKRTLGFPPFSQNQVVFPYAP